jgi:hypothetical protein
MRNQEQVNFLTIGQAGDLVDRIADRAENFNYTMSESEKEAMAQLLSDIGVRTSDLIDVANLADNYAINAEIIRPDDRKHYDMKRVKEDSLFQWKEDGETLYCLQW